MTAVKRGKGEEDEDATASKRAKNAKIPIPVDPEQDNSAKHAFLDDTTGFGGGISIRHFLNPQVVKLYTAVRVSTFLHFS
jgi:hypothetical protein